jgi:hypoxanthine phosphoribosyltransferase
MNEIIIICIVTLIHFILLNPLIKNIYYEYFGLDKRPLNKCKNDITFKCYGMPSGHVESATIFSLLLLNKQFINKFFAILIIIVFGLQRIYYKMHTIKQIIIGLFFGLIYSLIYINLLPNIKYVILFIILLILYYNHLLINIIDFNLNKKLPSWVDKSLIPLIEKKKNVAYYRKFIEIFFCTNLGLYNNTKLFCTWELLEKYMDNLINKIKKKKIKFDCIIGIKTGGAIICKYIAKKLNIKYYFIKVSKTKYNCNKKQFNTLTDIIDNHIIKKKSKYIVCEPIINNLKNQNLLVIDELISSGNTMKTVIDYLYIEKKVNSIYPLIISRATIGKRYTYPINLATKSNYIIWPWGYDN